LTKLLLLLLLFFGCRNSPPPRGTPERERKAVLYKVRGYLQREKPSYPGNGRPIFEKARIVRCDLKTLLQERPIFFDILEKGLLDNLKDSKGRFYFVGIPTSSHRGIIVVVEPREIIPISYGYYLIGE